MQVGHAAALSSGTAAGNNLGLLLWGASGRYGVLPIADVCGQLNPILYCGAQPVLSTLNPAVEYVTCSARAL